MVRPAVWLCFVTYVLAAVAATYCNVDEDCSLNGICNDLHTCECRPAWTGGDCGVLDLLPGAFPIYQKSNTSSWGGGIIKDDNGTYHLYVSVMNAHCGLNSWVHNSVLVHATADKIEGPYGNDSIIATQFSHNVRPTRDVDGSYLLFHIGCGDNSTKQIIDCANGTTPTSPTYGAAPYSLPVGHAVQWKNGCKSSYGTNVLYSASPNGPFEGVSVIVVNDPPFPASADNPSPIISQDGKVLVAFRSWQGSGDPEYASVIGIATSTSGWRGPYELPGYPILPAQEEDPFYWIDTTSGTHHMLYHNMGDTASRAPGTHAFSRDGVSWTLSNTTAYNFTVAMQGGQMVTMRRRERPSLLFDDNGNPLYLITGVMPPADRSGQNDYSFTLMQRLNAA